MSECVEISCLFETKIGGLKLFDTHDLHCQSVVIEDSSMCPTTLMVGCSRMDPASMALGGQKQGRKKAPLLCCFFM